LDKTVSHETAVDRGARRDDLELSSELVEDRAWAPAGMSPAQLDDASLDLGWDLMGAAIGLGAAIGESRKTLAGVAHEPAVKGPSVDPVAGGDFGDGGAVEYLPDGVVALLNHRKLHQHDDILLGSVEHK
jgi:hypothetical protein